MQIPTFKETEQALDKLTDLIYESEPEKHESLARILAWLTNFKYLNIEISLEEVIEISGINLIDVCTVMMSSVSKEPLIMNFPKQMIDIDDFCEKHLHT